METRPFILSITITALLSGSAKAQSSTSAEIAELRQQIQSLTEKVDDLQHQLNRGRLAPVFSDPANTASGKALIGTGQVADNPAPVETSLSMFNPEVSVALDAVASYSRRADNVNFIVRDAEIMLQASVDHLARAYAVFNAETELAPMEKADVFEEASLGIEEAAIETTDLPWGLKLKAGQFFADITRLGKVHSHELPFTDRPPSLDQIVGGEAKGRGVEVTWIPPINHYVRLSAGMLDGLGAEPTITARLTALDGEEEDLAAYRDSSRRSLSDVLYYARAATIVELGSQAQLSLGANYARGRDAGTRQLASTDFKLTWSPRAESYDLFELSGEYLWGRSRGTFGDEALFEAGPPGGPATARGGYVYAQYRFGKKWQPGIRFDYLEPLTWELRDNDDDGEADTVNRTTSRLQTCSAYLNYHLSEFNRLRLQLNYVRADQVILSGGKDDWQAFFQWTVVLGPHKHSFVP